MTVFQLHASGVFVHGPLDKLSDLILENINSWDREAKQ